MLESLQRLGIKLSHNPTDETCDVTGCGGQIAATEAELWLENSGTSIRFLTSVCTLGRGRYRLDGIERMRERPIGDLVDTLRSLGAVVECENDDSCPPVIVTQQERLQGGTADIAGDISSQFLSSLLMAAPAAQQTCRLNVAGELVSKPYVTMTLQMMKSFGVDVEFPDDLSSFALTPRSYRGRAYDIEPDASAASYFLGAAAVTSGTVTIEGLTKGALQGDIEFASALEQMGCEVEWNANSVTLTGRPLRGVEIDMNAISDTAQTLSAVAVFADKP